MRRKPPEAQQFPERYPGAWTAARLSRLLIILASAAIPLVVAPGFKDSFRLPKELLFRAEGIVLLALIGLAFVLDHRRATAIFFGDRSALIMGGTAICWVGVTSLLSVDPHTSAFSLLVLISAVVLFVVTIATERGGTAIFTSILIAGVANCVVYALQWFNIWNPFVFDEGTPPSLRATALLGTRDDVGVCVFFAALLAIVLATVADRWRGWYAGLAIALSAFILAIQALTPIVALWASIVCMAAPRSRRLLAMAILGPLLIILAMPTMYAPAKARTKVIHRALENGDIDQVLSGRVVAFRTALLMFRDHPVTGVGPGCYGRVFFGYKLRAQESDPALLRSESRTVSFGEAHNDYLQVLAETGLPGLVLFLAAGVWIARGTFIRKASPETLEQRIARSTSFPLVGGTAVLAAAQFPFHLAVSTMWFILIAAYCRRWSRCES